jgi:hypothetical protein
VDTNRPFQGSEHSPHHAKAKKRGMLGRHNILGEAMKTLTLKRLLVLASFLTIGAAAFVTPMPDGNPNWGNTVVGIASIGYLISLILIALDLAVARFLFLPSVLISLLGMPVASYPSGELNALYDLTMYVSGFLNGGLAILVYVPSLIKD